MTSDIQSDENHVCFMFTGALLFLSLILVFLEIYKQQVIVLWSHM